jgi:hypothetical protein
VKTTRAVFQHTVNQLTNIRNMLAESSFLSQMSYTHDSPNNCAVLDDQSVILITHTSNQEVTGYKLLFLRDLYTYPYSSNVLLIGYYIPTKHIRSGVPVTKAFCIPCQREYLVIPLA